VGDNIIQAKINSKRGERKKNTKEFIYQFGPILTYYGGESSSLFLMSFFTKRNQRLQKQVFKLNSTQSLESLPVTKRLYPNSVLFMVNQNNPNPSVFFANKNLYKP